MGCCGKLRQQVGRARPSPASTAPPAQRFTVAFEYTGDRALTVTGAVSGRRYRFDGRGARLTVDPRDRPSLARVPRLREAG